MATAPVISSVRKRKAYKQRTIANESDYKSLFRFEEVNLEWIASHFLGEQDETRGGALSSKKQMQIFLRYLSDPVFQTGVAEEMGVNQTTVCKTFSKVRQKIMDKANLWIKFPANQAEVTASQGTWQNKFKIPCVVGAVGCIDVRIAKSRDIGDEYFNRMGWPSIRVQATCDANEIFTSVNVQWPGSIPENKIFETSDTCRALKYLSDAVLIGDNRYGIAPWIMTPYESPTTVVEEYFNSVHATEGASIERCFGIIKRRFPILDSKIRLVLDRIPTLVLCCFVLHNIAKYLNDSEEFPELSVEDPPNQFEQVDCEGEDLEMASMRMRGREQRDVYAQVIYNNMELPA